MGIESIFGASLFYAYYCGLKSLVELIVVLNCCSAHGHVIIFNNYMTVVMNFFLLLLACFLWDSPFVFMLWGS